MGIHLTPAARPRGGTIFTALVTIGIMSVAVLAMLQYSLYQNRMTQRRVEREAVYYTAEAGVDQVVHYFNYPAEYADNTTFFTKDPTTGFYYQDNDNDGFGETNVFTVRMPTGTRTLVDSSTSPNPLTFGYDPSDGENRAQVTNLTLTLPDMTDPDTPLDSIIVVTSEGQNAEGQTRIVRATLSADPPFLLLMPAPIISLSTAGTYGQANVHWGEGWFMDNFMLPNGGLNNITTTDDPWANFRTVQNVMVDETHYADGTNGGSTTPLDPTAPNYYQPYLGTSRDPEHTNIYQHTDPASLDWPDPLDYDFWKNAAQTRGLYFSWDASGNLISGQNGDPLTIAEFYTEINQVDGVTTGASGADQVLPDPTIVFVDTIDGQPPAADGSNFCELTIEGGAGGNDIFLRGILYVGGDVNINVNGVSGLWVQDPDRVEDPTTGTEIQLTGNNDVFLNGVLYSAGVMDVYGSPAVYGSLFARGGFGSSGTPDVYYDYRLKSGLPFSFNSNVSIVRWEELHPDITGS